MNSREDKAANLETAGRLIERAVELGADLVALPELFNVLGTPQDILSGAEPIPGPTTAWLQERARSHGVYIHGGSIPVQVPGKDKCTNTTVVISPTGEIIARYDKIHLFDIEVRGRVSANESATFEPGDRVVTCDTEYGRFGLTICYDLRFPELYRALTLAGARVIFAPAAFTLYTGKDHWEVLVRARAVENQVYMVAPAQIGAHRPNKFSFGSAMIVNPWGTILARAPEEETVIVADVDYDYQEKVRRELPVLAHRRVEVYGEAWGFEPQAERR
jgi:predicted amidohydrolase